MSGEREYAGPAMLSTEHAAAVLVIGSLALLMLVRRGFRGVGVPGVGSLNIAGG